MENQDYRLNFSYIFIPFCIADEKKFFEFNKELLERENWVFSIDRISYLHKYVSDRLINETDGKHNLFRYRLSPKQTEHRESFFAEASYRTLPKKFKGEENVSFGFKISDVQLFAFNTSVCILAYQLCFDRNEPYYIAAAQYYLRKISTEEIVCQRDGEEKRQNFVNISKELLGELVDRYSPDFFFYAQPTTERANFFTYIDLPEKDDFSKELFYLKWCYGDSFVYKDESEEDDCIDYQADEKKNWGFSSSAAVCIVNRDDTNRDFVEKVFQKNFQNQYLFTYVFLLHQKYMLYLFLTRISVDIDKDLNLLEDYKRRLYEFETKYVFTQISEVPQYQRFYEKISSVFKIKEMFVDVQEPLSYLAEIQRLNNDSAQQKRDQSVNTALISLSLLTIVSAFADIGGIMENVVGYTFKGLSDVVQWVVFFLVFGISVWAVCRLFAIGKDNLKKNDKKRTGKIKKAIRGFFTRKKR